MRVSQERFAKDLADLCDPKGQYYDNIKLPQRATSGSAGYDFCSPIDVLLGPKESVRIPTGIRCRIDEGYVLELARVAEHIRSQRVLDAQPLDEGLIGLRCREACFGPSCVGAPEAHGEVILTNVVGCT